MNFNWGSHRNEVELVEAPLWWKRMEKDGDYPVAIAWSTWLTNWRSQGLREGAIMGVASSYSSMHQTLLLPAFPCEPQDIACSYKSFSRQEQSHLKVVPLQVSNSNILQLSWCQFKRWTSHASGARFGQLCDSWARHLQCAHHLICLLSNSSTLPGAPPACFFRWWGRDSGRLVVLVAIMAVFRLTNTQLFQGNCFSLSLKEGLSCKTSILLQANYMWSSKILKAGPVGWGLAQEWGTSERQTIDYLRSTWFNMGYSMMFVRSGIDNHPIVEVISHPHVLLCVD